MVELFIDTETYCATPINHGTHRYAEGVEVMLFPWAIGDEPPSCWDIAAGEPMPPRLLAALRAADTKIIIHNSGFDRTVLRHWWPKSGLPPVDWSVERINDTMVQALLHSLPGALEKLGAILGISEDQAKLKDGKALIHLFCKPQAFKHKLTKEAFATPKAFREAVAALRAAWPGRATRHSHPAEWQRFKEYAINDVEAMRAIYRKLPAWNYRGAERKTWELDQHINDRGVAVDLGLAHGAIAAADMEQARLADVTQFLTMGDVTAATQRDAMLHHILVGFGIELPDLRSRTVENFLTDNPDAPEDLRELLSVRLMASMTSSSKYKRLIEATSSDGRLRGLLQYCGAMRTGRWAGRVFQPQNLPRTPKHLKKRIAEAIEAIKSGDVDLLFDNVMEVLSACIRGCIVAPAGKKLVVADLSNIEGRKLAWLAGERWKLRAFADYDAGTGHDLYVLAYSRSFNLPPEVVQADNEAGGDMRQIGKVQELALGYQGGTGAFGSMAAIYGVNLPKAKQQAIVKAWRRANAAIASLWGELEDAVRAAINNPGQAFPAGKHLWVQRNGAWLRIRLPSGRYLCYPQPAVGDDGKLSYMGVNQYTRKWERIKTYGGKLVENVTQAAARDVLAHNMHLIEAAGYRIVLTVHDEVICEAPDRPEFNAVHLSSLLSIVPEWAPGLPLASAGFEAYRYRKD